MTRPTIATAYARLMERKHAAGVPPVVGPPGRRSLDDAAGVLAGTDLDPDEVKEWTARQGKGTVPLILSYGPEVAGGSKWVDGLLTGLELAALRAEDDDLGGRNRNLRRLLLELAELVLEADDAGEVKRAAGGRGAGAVAAAETILETIR